MSTPMMHTLREAMTLLGVDMPPFDDDKRNRAYNTALLIIDVQRDFCPPPTPGEKGWGALAVTGGNEIVVIINKLRLSVQFDCVVLSQDYHTKDQASFASRYSPAFPERKPVKFTYASGKVVPAQNLWPDHCVNDTDGVKFHPDLIHDTRSDIIVRKGKDPNVDSYSAFCDNLQAQDTPLHAILSARNISNIVVVGLAYDYCVGFTALDGYDRKYNVTVCKDACRSVDPDGTGEAMTQRLIKSGITLVSTDEYIRSVKPVIYMLPLPAEYLISVNDAALEKIDRFHAKTPPDNNGRKRNWRTLPQNPIDV
jgi:nicotinamidase/pyrazinamidase